MNLESICKKVIELEKEVGEFLMKEVHKLNSENVNEKGKHNYVTNVDIASEKMLIKGLSEILPEAAFITEENTIKQENKQYKWIVDPLDGTTNFIHSVPLFCISIALMKDDEVVVGVVYEPNLKECFYAWKGSKAYLNENEIKVSKTAKLNNSLLATGFPYSDYKDFVSYLKIFEWMIINTRGIRRLGSAAVDMCYVACGRFDGFYEYGLGAWDVAAGVLIIKQAGGKIADFAGNKNYIFGKEIIATNELIFDEMIGLFANYK
ncbi:MAG: inositol monophosphatase [Saprospiraceae bacterium]|nr:inositol monophosphatase [Saprospiraceae bacterium]